MVGIVSFDFLSFHCAPHHPLSTHLLLEYEAELPTLLCFPDFDQNAPTWTPETGAPCVLPSVLCTATGHDTYLFLVTFWATIQLSWTLILLASQTWQMCKQMTTLEVSNLGKYGFMGGRGGASLKDQSGALAHFAGSAGGGMGVAGSGGETSLDPNDIEDGVGAPPPPPRSGATGSLAGHAHGHAHRHSSKGQFAFCLQILGLDLFTRGKAAKGLSLANKDANPFDQGLVSVRSPSALTAYTPTLIVRPTLLLFRIALTSGRWEEDWASTTGSCTRSRHTAGRRRASPCPSTERASSQSLTKLLAFVRRSKHPKMLLPTFSLPGGGSGGEGRGYQPLRTSEEDV